jgi:hypothetical protein
VVHLRLEPGPCGREAMVQLVNPLDGDDCMFVNSYAGVAAASPADPAS